LSEAKFNPGWKAKVENIIRGQGYENGPWLFKHGATFHKVWNEFSPKWIKVKRDPEAIYKSYRHSGMLRRADDAQLKEIISYHHKILDDLPGITINSDSVVGGNYSDLEEAFDYCGLGFDSKIADKFINKEYWHFS
jgi:hypothetical protein